MQAPAFTIIGSEEDNPLGWLRAGQALSHVLLRAAAAGVSASYYNQPIEVDEILQRLQSLIDQDGVPQILMRLGYGPITKTLTPRRRVAEIITTAGRD